MRWAEKNKTHKNYLARRSTARGFIRSFASLEDLAELRGIIDERAEQLKEGADSGTK